MINFYGHTSSIESKNAFFSLLHLLILVVLDKKQLPIFNAFFALAAIAFLDAIDFIIVLVVYSFMMSEIRTLFFFFFDHELNCEPMDFLSVHGVDLHASLPRIVKYICMMVFCSL